MRYLSRATIVLLAGAALIAVPAAEAQNRDPDTAIKLSLSPPGARSLGLGGAFLALADDATAAYTNPAGLTNLTLGGSEVTVELRQNQFRNSFADRGHFSLEPGTDPKPTNRGVDFEDFFGLVRDEASSETSGISFLSFAYVLPRGLTLALYRHELGDFATRFQTKGPFADARVDNCLATDVTPDGLCVTRFSPRQAETELEIVNYGLSGAYELKLPTLKGKESTLSIGAGVSYYELALFAFNQFYDLGRFTGLSSRLPGGFYGPPDYDPGNISFDSAEIGDDYAFGINLGFLWKLGRQQRWSVGGVFRQGPDFTTEKDLRACVELDPLDPNNITIVCGFGDLQSGVFTVPDVIGLGLAYRTAEGKTKILFDLNRVRYSQRLIDFTEGLNPAPGFPRAEDFQIEDADQLHFGVERTVLVVESLFVGTARFGAWREPFHELEYFGDNEVTAAFLRRPKDAEIHYSAGFGLVIKEDYQIDFAADLSDPNNTFSFSLVKFF
jgi:long-chain fatty acid transport protein